MKQHETRDEFLEKHGKAHTGTGQFNVYRIEEFSDHISLPPHRRDYYKISLVIDCEGILSYADKTIHIKNNAISFANPMIPYSWEPLTAKATGYFCIFTDNFVSPYLKTDSLAHSSLFRINGNPVLFPDEQSMAFLSSIFEQMLTEMNSLYSNKYELLRSYVQIIIHEALKMEPPGERYKAGTSLTRITDLFLKLLDRQYPLVSPQHVIKLKNAGDFARQLSIHTNHLNRSLKETTGKTTSEHIADRMTLEARALLLYSNWDIAEIGYCLGFEHASNFNIFFKKQTGQTPNHFRKQIVVSA